MKDLLRTADLTPADVQLIVGLAAELKADPYTHRTLLRGDTVVLYFNKPSTRTRISFETAVARLGGVPIGVGPDELQLGRGETIEDTASVLSRYSRAVTIRTFSDEDVRRFAAAATVPVVNALTDQHHPCQSMADLLTLQERFGDLREVRLAYVGDGNNVAHSLIEAAALVGMHIAVATPSEYAPNSEILQNARRIAATTDATLIVTGDPVEAVTGADAVYTDAWVSMGDSEKEHDARVQAFMPYQVNAGLMARASPGAIFMHCLPDHRGEEVTAAVVDGPQSVVFDQAENRLHTAKAILVALLQAKVRGHSAESSPGEED